LILARVEVDAAPRRKSAAAAADRRAQFNFGIAGVATALLRAT
jgi:hypothetical protein